MSKGYGFGIDEPDNRLIVIADSENIHISPRGGCVIRKGEMTYGFGGFINEEDYASDDGEIDLNKLAESIKAAIFEHLSDESCKELAEKRYVKEGRRELVLIETNVKSMTNSSVRGKGFTEYRLNDEYILRFISEEFFRSGK